MSRTVSVRAQALINCLGSRHWPRVIDVRRAKTYELAEDVLPGAAWHDHREAASWGRKLGDGRVIVYCAHGDELSQAAATLLRSMGIDAAFLEGGMAAWRALGGATIYREMQAGVRQSGQSRWVTWEKHPVDQLGCPWFIRRYVDPDAMFHFVSADYVAAVALEISAIPFDVPNAPFSHEGSNCTFDALMRFFRIADPNVARLATIVRGGDTNAFDLAPECAGLRAICEGIAYDAMEERYLLASGLALYDAIYQWVRRKPVSEAVAGPSNPGP